jgi:hypothetical protein
MYAKNAFRNKSKSRMHLGIRGKSRMYLGIRGKSRMYLRTGVKVECI